jgi:hypothetical protein
LKTLIPFVLCSNHAFERYLQRNITQSELKEFLKRLKKELCVVVFELVKDGCVDGRSKKYDSGNSTFVLTFDQSKMCIIIKTMLDRKSK